MTGQRSNTTKGVNSDHKAAGMEAPGALERSMEAEAAALVEVAAAVIARCEEEVRRLEADKT